MTFKWGTVTAVSPLRVVLDGDTTALPFTLDSLVASSSLAVNDRVRCELSARRVIITGRSGGTSGGGGGGTGIVETIVAGTNVTVDSTDPANPIVSAGGGSGVVETVVAGTNVTVDSTDPANPIVSAAGLPTRTTATYTTASLANNAQETGLITLAPGYRVYKVVLSVQGRVRLYDSTAHRTADLSRAKGTPIDPLTDSGLMLEVALQTGSLTRVLSPVVDGVNFETGDGVPITVQNLSGSSSVVTVTVTYVKAE